MLANLILATALQAGGPALVNTGQVLNPTGVLRQRGAKTIFVSSIDSELDVYDAETQSLVSTGLVVADGPFVYGELVLFLVDEAVLGQDLDQDGKTDHLIYHVLDLESYVVTSLDVPGVASMFIFGSEMRSSLLGFVVPESDAGDLNGDGDAIDLVAHVFDAQTGEVRNLGLATFAPPPIEGDQVFVHVAESSQGQGDLNGDGVLSFVLFRHDFTPNKTLNTGFAGAKGPPGLAFQEESFTTGDLNGDGLTTPGLGLYYELDDVTGAATPLGFGFQSFLVAWAFAEGFTGLHASESAIGSGFDLNGDGDQLDNSIVGYFPRSGRIERLGLGGAEGFFVAHREGSRVSVTSAIREDYEQVDVTGDGDALDSFVRHWDSEAGVKALPLALQGQILAGAGSLVSIRVSETEQAVDLNGDGEISGSVEVLHDFSQDRTWILESIFGRFLSGKIFYSFRSELADGVDLTGDGDLNDAVLASLNTQSGVEVMYPNPVGINSFGGLALSNGYFAIGVLEDGIDLNGDGDTDDFVLHVAVP